MAAKKTSNLKIVDQYVERHTEDVLHAMRDAHHDQAEDDRKLSVNLGVIANKIDDYTIEQVLALKDTRHEDRWHHSVNGVVALTRIMSGTIRRLEHIMNFTLPAEYKGAPAGSTGTPGGDLDKLVELTANAAYIVGLMQGARLEGASQEKIERIASFASL